ncbi:hypothetical protein B0H11DRAFT_191850 [Mycena galericulata]|nr:hypothetical protein B0H11DRAFT_191850 [Mycena galericulata]
MLPRSDSSLRAYGRPLCFTPMAARTSRTRPAGTNPCLALRRRLTYLPTASVLYLHSPPMPRLLERMTITAWSPRVSNATVISHRSTRSNNSYSSSSSSSRRTSIPTPNRPSPSHPYNPCGTLPSPPVPGSFRALPFLSTDLPRTIVPLVRSAKRLRQGGPFVRRVRRPRRQQGGLEGRRNVV